MPNKIKIAHSELMDIKNNVKFLRLFGRTRYYEMLEKISVKRFGDGSLDRLAERVENASDEEYEKLMPILKKEQEKLVPMKKEAYIEVEPPDFATDNRMDEFIELLGAERYFKAIGFEGLETADKQALKKVNSNANLYEDTQHRVQSKKDVVHEHESGSTADQQTDKDRA